MAGQTAATQSTPYLTNTQQDLLLAALSSNKPNTMSNSQRIPTVKRSPSDPDQTIMPNTLYASPQQAPSRDNFSSLDFDTSPYLDYPNGDTSFDLDEHDLGGQEMIGPLHDKRKITDEDEDEDEEGDSKRREGDDKQAKKPGRKPLTNEPTTVSCQV